MKTVLAAALVTLASSSVMADNFRDNGVWDRHLTPPDNTSNIQIHTRGDLTAYEESAFDVRQYDRTKAGSLQLNLEGSDVAYQEGHYDIPS